ncbi:hypothetical protein [Nocardia salmonicida]|uniref:hypothetical protein n=1 Tax=Nocardia salmonicida TaxID=53431 RepID=UPI002E2D21FB|nr:hypothetical protein [Nocardia salmonicida]
MQREHEETMREDFARYASLEMAITRGYTHADTDGEIGRSLDARDQLSDSWNNGPHAEHWDYLTKAYDGWVGEPKRMVARYADIAHNPHSGMTEVQRRSIAQAAAQAARTYPATREAMQRAVVDRGHGPIERSR